MINLQKYERLKLILIYSADDGDDENDDDDDERGPGICRRLISRPVQAGRCWDGDRDRDRDIDDFDFDDIDSQGNDNIYYVSSQAHN